MRLSVTAWRFSTHVQTSGRELHGVRNQHDVTTELRFLAEGVFVRDGEKQKMAVAFARNQTLARGKGGVQSDELARRGKGRFAAAGQQELACGASALERRPADPQEELLPAKLRSGCVPSADHDEPLVVVLRGRPAFEATECRPSG